MSVGIAIFFLIGSALTASPSALNHYQAPIQTLHEENGIESHPDSASADPFLLYLESLSRGADDSFSDQSLEAISASDAEIDSLAAGHAGRRHVRFRFRPRTPV